LKSIRIGKKKVGGGKRGGHFALVGTGRIRQCTPKSEKSEGRETFHTGADSEGTKLKKICTILEMMKAAPRRGRRRSEIKRLWERVIGGENTKLFL